MRTVNAPRITRTRRLCQVALLCLLCLLCQPIFAATPKATPLLGQITHVLLATTLIRPLSRKEPRREVIVYTPPGYNNPANVNTRYPVLYLLHGSPGHPSDFLNFGDWPRILEQTPGLTPTILVIPDGNYVGEKHGDSEWANSADGRDRFEDFVVRQVVSWTDAHYRTQTNSAGRFIGGVSEGGYGAVNLTLRHPDVFGGALACSGYYDNQGAGWARPILGYNAVFLRANSPLDYVGDAITAGRVPPAWKALHIFLGAGDDEKRYYIETRAMAAKLKDAGVPVTLDILDGKHGWGLWNQLFTSGAKTLLAAPSGGG
ncbi:MAG: esterase family protein [Armatimonadota bacterium]|nr:esterase family protein [Armatimonadota bacterium]